MKFKQFINSDDVDFEEICFSIIENDEDELNEAAGNASKETRLQECLHCVAFGIRQNKRSNIIESDVMDRSQFSQGYSLHCNLDSSGDEIFDFAERKPDWVKSVVTSTNAFFKSPYSKKAPYDFYRGTGIMNMVYQEFNKMKSLEGIKLPNDKWNPGDIWAASSSFHPNFGSFSSLLEYNAYIADQLEKNTLMGISLKKVGGNAKVVVVGKDKIDMTPVGFKGIRKPRNIFSTGIMIDLSNGWSINVRSFRISQNADVRGEIIGKTARHGKFAVTNIIKKYSISQLPLSKISKMTDEELRDIVVKLWSDIGYKYSQNDIDRGFENLLNGKEPLEKRGRNGFWQSAIHSLQFGEFLVKNKGKADEIVNEIYFGASSVSDYSSNFIKIY